VSEQDHRRDYARVLCAVGGASGDRPPSQSVVPVERSNVLVARASVNEDGIYRVAVRCRACNGRAFDVLGVHADVHMPCRAQFASLWVARRCVCGRTVAGRVAAQPGQPPPLGLAGSWRCTRGHFLAEIDPTLGRLRLPCRKCRLELYAIAAEVIRAAQFEELAQAS
jgi:hypothetical protein